MVFGFHLPIKLVKFGTKYQQRKNKKKFRIIIKIQAFFFFLIQKINTKVNEPPTTPMILPQATADTLSIGKANGNTEIKKAVK